MYPEKILIQKDTFTPVFTAQLFTIGTTWNQFKCQSSDEWIKKMWYIYIHSGILAIKDSETMSLAATCNITGPRDDHMQWSKS